MAVDRTEDAKPAICDYEGSDYRTRFWESADRAYEDAAERIALRRLLPPAGRRLVELGAGFGRLADLYTGYQQVILLDYARSMLREAQSRLGGDERFLFVAADLYHLPFADGALDTAVTVRVLHHVQNLPAAFVEIQRALRPGGSYVLEYANKRHAKAVLRYFLRRQAASPFSQEPYEFVHLNFNFHPTYVANHLQAVGFALKDQRAVSTFRLPWLKRLVNPRWLATLDGLLQAPTAPLRLAPSMFLRAVAEKPGPAELSEQLWRCPRCKSTELGEEAEAVQCFTCNTRWPIKEGIYQFKL